MSLADIAAQLVAEGVKHVYAENAVPKLPEYPYVVVASSYGAPAAATMNGHSHTPRWLTVKAFGRTIAALEATTDAIDAAFNGRALPLPGDPVAEFLQANQMSRDAADGGVLGMVLTYRY